MKFGWVFFLKYNAFIGERSKWFYYEHLNFASVNKFGSFIWHVVSMTFHFGVELNSRFNMK